jgi:hypothetical protein
VDAWRGHGRGDLGDEPREHQASTVAGRGGGQRLREAGPCEACGGAYAIAGEGPVAEAGEAHEVAGWRAEDVTRAARVHAARASRRNRVARAGETATGPSRQATPRAGRLSPDQTTTVARGSPWRMPAEMWPTTVGAGRDAATARPGLWPRPRAATKRRCRSIRFMRGVVGVSGACAGEGTRGTS